MPVVDHAAVLAELLTLVDERFQEAIRAGIAGLEDTARLDKVAQFQLDIETDIEAGWLVIGVDVSEGETIRSAIDGVPE